MECGPPDSIIWAQGILLKSKTLLYTRGPHDSPDAIKVYSNNVYANAQSLLDMECHLKTNIHHGWHCCHSIEGKVAGDRVSQGLNESMIQGQNNVLGGYYQNRNKLFFQTMLSTLLMVFAIQGGSSVYEGRDYEIDPQRCAIACSTSPQK